MAHTAAGALRENFLGNSPAWYKLTIVGFLILNPILVTIDPFIAGWALVVEFIFTLAMALLAPWLARWMNPPGDVRSRNDER